MRSGAGCRFQSEPQHNSASVIRKLLTCSTLPCGLRSTVGQWGRRGMINLLARRVVNWIPAIDPDVGARDTLHLTPSVACTEEPSASDRRTKIRLSQSLARMLDDDAVVSAPPARERLTINAVTVERCVSLSTSQTLPLAWRASATLLEKAEGLLCHWHIWSDQLGEVRSEIRDNAELSSSPETSRNRPRSAALTNSIRGSAFIGSPVFPRGYGIYCDRERRVARHLGQIDHPATGHSDPHRPRAFHTRIARQALRDLSCERPASRERRLKSFIRSFSGPRCILGWFSMLPRVGAQVSHKFDNTETTWSTSLRVVSRRRDKRTAPCRTCHGAIEQDPQADPSEAAMLARLRSWRIASLSPSDLGSSRRQTGERHAQHARSHQEG